MLELFPQRLVGAIALDGRTYEDVEADRHATGQALLVVVLASLGAGIGLPRGNGPDLPVVAMHTFAGLLAWVTWAVLIYLLGVRLFPTAETRSSVGELLRTIGFATAPGLVCALGVLPVVGPVIFVGASVWMFVTMVVAVRHALDYTRFWRALAVCAAGWLLSLLVLIVIGVVFPQPVF